MKIHKLIGTLLTAVAFASASQFINPSTALSVPEPWGGGYSATLISPTAGAVLYPGERVRVEWSATLPSTSANMCEAELWLSLDGGRTFSFCITPQMDPKVRYFYWTVPNMPTKTAVLDIRFGCEHYYPECYSPQPQSPFVISSLGGN
jgi:hypothetical protein